MLVGVLFANLQSVDFILASNFTHKIIGHTYFVREVDIVLDPHIVVVTL